MNSFRVKWRRKIDLKSTEFINFFKNFSEKLQKSQIFLVNFPMKNLGYALRISEKISSKIYYWKTHFFADVREKIKKYFLFHKTGTRKKSVYKHVEKGSSCTKQNEIGFWKIAAGIWILRAPFEENSLKN